MAIRVLKLRWCLVFPIHMEPANSHVRKWSIELFDAVHGTAVTCQTSIHYRGLSANCQVSHYLIYVIIFQYLTAGLFIDLSL